MTLGKRPPLPNQILQTVVNLDTYEGMSGRYDTLNVDEAQVMTSMLGMFGNATDEGGKPLKFGTHKVVLDIDLPAQLIPSSTPGHYHLIIDREVTWEHYAAMLITMGAAGILEPGYVGASLARGYTAVRLPWVKKQPATVDLSKIKSQEPTPF